MPETKEVVIYQPWGGLGDNLAHTPIPRLCAENGYKCFLSKHNVYRNKEIYDLLYKDLDTIEGELDIITTDWKNYKSKEEKNWNHIRSIQVGYGFEKAPYYYPFICYTPKYIDSLKNTTLVDLAGYHCYDNYSQYYNKDNLLYTSNVAIDHKKLKNLVTIEKTHYKNIDIKLTEETYKINSLFDYADALFSCENFLCIDSGPGNLACAIKNQFKTDTNIIILGMSFQLPPKKYDTYNYKNAYYYTTDSHEYIAYED